MNRYLDIIDDAINAIHAKAWSDRPDSSEKYDADLQKMFERRSFVEFAFDVEEEK